MVAPARPSVSTRGLYLRKRQKTRERLLQAAKRVMAETGAEAATIAEIAAAADVSPGTFYNYFQTREEILDAVAVSLVEEFRRVMDAIQRAVDDPAERIAIAIRLFLGRVRDDRLWGWFMARYAPTLPILRDQTREIIRERIVADGLRRRRFRLPSTRAVGDLIAGTSVTALRSILEGRAPIEIATEVAELVLRGLGVPLVDAHRIANRPIPPLTLPPTQASGKDFTNEFPVARSP
ncbi:MAG TPA: TetR/AcrR family transcriptional regulator [Candidatus Binatia bacterium]|nr:TetR/AcrR family transcriptional regulator [Candidatus Binatia bacterium]